MRDPQRIDRIINKLRDYWKTYPDLRFNQMIYNITFPLSDDPNQVFNIEDDNFEKMIDTTGKNLGVGYHTLKNNTIGS